MFTGLVETIGTVKSVVARQGATAITIESGLPVDEMVIGESVSVNGVCLTVTALEGRTFSADAVQETLSRSTLAGLHAGQQVNLERALKLDDRLGGHLVQGHVDAVAPVTGAHRRSDWLQLAFTIPEDLADFVVEKGSVAVNGVSLTVARLDGLQAEIAIIPQTLSATNLGDLKPGDGFNFEVDVLGKYVARMLEQRGDIPAKSESSSIDEQMLADHGFL